MNIRLGTRGSRLALAQATLVSRLIRSSNPSVQVEIVEIRTSGDRIQDVVLGPARGQSFFTKEIEAALIAGEIDLAVHSCKDLATAQPAGLCLGAILEREDPRDALVAIGGRRLSELAPGSVVGTASVRRQAFLSRHRPDLAFENLRGNVPTRLDKVVEGRMDAVVLACAGLHRLGYEDRISERIDPEILLPAAAQGAIAVQVRCDDVPVHSVVGSIDHAPSRVQVVAERACLNTLEAGCQAPVGVLARPSGRERLRLDAAVVLPDATARGFLEGPSAEADSLGRSVALDLLAQLAVDSLRDLGLGRDVDPAEGL
jgi:hydroxymethylbilane synthase